MKQQLNRSYRLMSFLSFDFRFFFIMYVTGYNHRLNDLCGKLRSKTPEPTSSTDHPTPFDEEETPSHQMSLGAGWYIAEVTRIEIRPHQLFQNYCKYFVGSINDAIRSERKKKRCSFRRCNYFCFLNLSSSFGGPSANVYFVSYSVAKSL